MLSVHCAYITFSEFPRDQVAGMSRLVCAALSASLMNYAILYCMLYGSLVAWLSDWASSISWQSNPIRFLG